MSSSVTVTDESFERLGFNPSEVLGQGFSLAGFSFKLDVDSKRFEFNVWLDAPDGAAAETVEHQMSLVVRGFERALQIQGMLDESGLDLFRNNASQATLNGRRLEIPKDW